MRKGKEILAVFLIILIGVAVVYSLAASCRRLSCVGMESLSLFTAKETYQNDASQYRALLTHDTDLLRVEARYHVTKQDAARITNSQIARIRGLFANSAAPYPGMVSNEISCGEKYTPKFFSLQKSGMTISYFTGYLNDRLVFGSCTDDQAVYKGVLILFYCSGRQELFQFELIAPVKVFDANPQKYRAAAESITCR